MDFYTRKYNLEANVFFELRDNEDDWDGVIQIADVEVFRKKVPPGTHHYDVLKIFIQEQYKVG
jgi:hypothetical protein